MIIIRMLLNYTEKKLINLGSNGPLGDLMVTAELSRTSLCIWVYVNFSGKRVYRFNQILKD